MFLFSLVLAAPLSIDLDGDGKPESVRVDNEAYEVHIGSHTVACYGDPCEVAAHDVSSADKGREVAVCAHGPRDDQTCKLYTIRSGELVTYTWPREWDPPSLHTSGNGLVLVKDGYRQRLIDRVEKYRVEGTKLVLVAQPVYVAETPKELKVDRTFPLLYAPDSKTVVANTRPDSTIRIVGEHGEKEGWMLVRLSSGIAGYVHVDQLARVSDDYQRTLGAG